MQWSELLVSTTVAWVRFSNSVTCGVICLGFTSLFRGISPSPPVFLLFVKTNIPIPPLNMYKEFSPYKSLNYCYHCDKYFIGTVIVVAVVVITVIIIIIIITIIIFFITITLIIIIFIFIVFL